MADPGSDARLPALFVAVPLPAGVAASLAPLRPPRGRGVRPVPTDRLHLTLHYLGPVPARPAIEALSAVRGERFEMRLAGTGTFGHPRRGCVLWVGVEPHPALVALQGAVTDALGVVERRPFRPHVTLARCRPPVDRDLLDAFRGRPFSASFGVDACVLYASHPAAEGPPEYRVRMRIPLDETTRPATPADLDAILALLVASGLPTEGVEENLDGFRVVERDGTVVAAGGLEPCGEAALLRSVVVSDRERGRSLGRRVVEALLEDARRTGVTDLWLLTETAPGFFANFGFEAVERASAPEAVRETEEFRSLCGPAATAMLRRG